MRITFYGAAHEVTGSCHCITVGGKNLLVDCGMEQGPDLYENQQLEVNPCDVDCVLLTHAHIDHSGMLPYLYAHGFRGKVFSTTATQELCEIMLRDSAHIQMFEAEWRNRKAKRSGGRIFEPVYTMEDAEGTLKLFSGCEYGKTIIPCEGVKARFIDVGHLLGSACIEVWLTEDGIERKIVFSGDIGNTNQPLILDPQIVEEADYVVMESTYGDRNHNKRPDYARELAAVIQKTFDRGGNVIVPSFAVGRTQELLYFIRKIKADGLVKNHGNFEVYVDSPLAIEATNIFQSNVSDCFDEEATQLINAGINPLKFSGLKFSLSSDESRLINSDNKPKVIISASGMCEAGRIRHHLKHNLWRSECTVLFVGYQGAGTLGRILLDGANEVRLFGEIIKVKAQITQLDGISAHADQNGLIKWVTSINPKPEKVFVVHGEDKVCDLFAAKLANEYGISSYAPYSGASFDLNTGYCIDEGVNVRIKQTSKTEKQKSPQYERLLSSVNRLMTLASRSRGLANKELAKLTAQITSLCDKWEK